MRDDGTVQAGDGEARRGILSPITQWQASMVLSERDSMRTLIDPCVADRAEDAALKADAPVLTHLVVLA